MTKMRGRLREPGTIRTPRILALAVALLSWAPPSRCDTLFVPAQHPTIQDAITAAAPDDIIRIANGIYPESVTLNKRVTLDGAGPLTIISPVSGDGILISASGSGTNAPLIIRDLTLATCPGNGVRIDSPVSHLALENVTISNCTSHGFELGNTAIVNDLVLSNCALVGMTNAIGMRVGGSLAGFLAIDCRFHDNQFGFESVKGDGDGTAFSDVRFERCAFINNTIKGAYFEKLANAVFDTISVAANGSVAPDPAGIDINLKHGAYSNIAFIATAIADCGLGDPATGAGISIKARNDGPYAISPASLTNVSISGTVITRCPIGITIGNNVSGILVEGSSLVGNFVLDIFNWTDSATITAAANWWGDDAGPSQSSATPPGTIFTGFGDRLFWTSNSSVTAAPPLAKPSQTNALYILPNNGSIFIQPGDSILAELNVANLSTNVNACQAMLGYSSALFREPSLGAVTAGGGIWDLLIWDSWVDTNGIPGEIDAAIGIDAQGAVGTAADGTIARISLTSRDDVEGVAHLVFRPDPPDDPGAVQTTMLADIAGNPIHPAAIDSTTIYVDGTPPIMETGSMAAIQEQAPYGFVDVKDGANVVQDGFVLFALAASDPLSGLVAPPAILLTNASTTTTATFIDESPTGIFNYAWEVTPATPGGPWAAVASATDRSGNSTERSLALLLRSFSITGLVELEGSRGTATAHSRTVTFAATGGSETKIWTQSLTNVTGAVFEFALDDVPPGTTHLSAKSNWNLRRKIPVAFDPYTATVLLTGASKLLAGDINADNRIQAFDYALLRNYYFQINAQADLNGDGAVQAFDYALLRGNWFVAGDPE